MVRSRVFWSASSYPPEQAPELVVPARSWCSDAPCPPPFPPPGYLSFPNHRLHQRRIDRLLPQDSLPVQPPHAFAPRILPHNAVRVIPAPRFNTPASRRISEPALANGFVPVDNLSVRSESSTASRPHGLTRR
ncbi:hypothetical protein L1887_50600 [Cichorium endivia]|nr:hypothetical protein L1887_50600 [Cichorium endivia]